MYESWSDDRREVIAAVLARKDHRLEEQKHDKDAHDPPYTFDRKRFEPLVI